MIDGALVLDGHMDTSLRLADGADLAAGIEGGHVDLPRMRAGGLDAAFFAAWVDPAFGPDRSLERALALLATIRAAAAARPDALAFATSAADVRAAVAGGRIALLAGVENGDALEGRVENAAALHGAGARYLTLTWSDTNPFGDAAGDEPRHGGLSPLGLELVDELGRLGMLVDLAHAAPTTFYDALERSADPPVVSHSATEAGGPHPRNLADDQLRAVGERGGVVGVNFHPGFLDPARAETPWTRIVDHLERIVEVAGVETAALGSDLDGIPRLPTGFGGVDDLPLVAGELERRGFAPGERAAILGGNWLRVLESTVDARS